MLPTARVGVAAWFYLSHFPVFVFMPASSPISYMHIICINKIDFCGNMMWANRSVSLILIKDKPETFCEVTRCPAERSGTVSRLHRNFDSRFDEIKRLFNVSPTDFKSSRRMIVFIMMVLRQH